MARRAITEEMHAKLLEAFRREPGNFAAAARSAGLNARTAKRGWERGWPGRRAVRDVLAEEQLAARAALRREQLRAEREAAGELAAEDAAAMRAAELRISRAAQGLALAAVAPVVRLQRVAGALAEKLEKMDTSTLKPLEVVGVLRQVTSTGRELVELMHKSLEVERLRAGDPSVIVGLKPMQPDAPVSLDEMAAEVEAAQRALDRAKAKTLPDGGPDGGDLH